MEALRDAESGKAQHMKGDALDVVVPEGVSEVVLEDGVSAISSSLGNHRTNANRFAKEVLKLPPTPTQVEDDYGDGDPETEKVHYEKHASQLTDSLARAHIYDNATSAPTGQAPATPPPLPPRFKGSATDVVDETVQGADVAHPTSGESQSSHTVNLNEMDPAEAREWQQHLEQEEQERLAVQRQSLDVGKSEQQPALDLGKPEQQPASEVDTAGQQPRSDSTRPPTSLSNADDDVFHDAVTASELPPVYSGAPIEAVPGEKSEERLDLK